METRNGNTKANGHPGTPKVRETSVGCDAANKVGKEKEPLIPIRQVPMGCVCEWEPMVGGVGRS